MRKKFFAMILTIFLCAVLVNCVYAEEKQVARENEILVLESEGEHFARILESVAFFYDTLEVDNFSIEKLDDYKVLLITDTYANQLSNLEQNKIAQLVKNNGLKIITNGKSQLVKALLINHSSKVIETNELLDLRHEEIQINLKENITFEVFDIQSDFYGVIDPKSGESVLSAYSYGLGKVVYVATDIDFSWAEGYMTYPYLHEYLIEYFQIKPLVSSDNLIAYFDWGYHYDKDPFMLAKRFREEGINEIHISAWYDVNDYKIFLEKFINACHANGVLVYAWLEYPMITSSFYEENEEFREVTVMGTNAEMTWRRLVALDIEECQIAVKEKAKEFFSTYDFDGVDFAELYYELPVGDEIVTFDYTVSGLSEYEKNYLNFFTPMNDTFRYGYKELFGYDPLDIFNEDSLYFFKKNHAAFDNFIDYRRLVLKNLNETFIEFFMDDKIFGKSLDVVVTQIDSEFDDTILVETGVLADDFIELQNKHDFTFMIEDPFPLWSEGPSRYTLIGERYGSHMSSFDKFYIDINVVNRVDTIYPNQKQTGLEISMLLSNAAKAASKVCIYAENTPYRFDYAYTSNSLASMVEKDGDVFKSERKFDLIFPTENKHIYVNGENYPGVNGEKIILNSGEHNITYVEAEDRMSFRVTDINVDFKSLKYVEGGIEIIFDTPVNKFIRLNKMPKAVIVDGKEVEFDAFYQKGEYLIDIDIPAKKVTLLENGFKDIYTSLFINAKEAKLSKHPVIIEDRCMVPVEEALKMIGAKYEIHDEFLDPTVFGEYNGHVFWLQSNNIKAKANGEDVTLDIAAYIDEDTGKMMVPVRFIFEAFGFFVDWYQEKNLVLIE